MAGSCSKAAAPCAPLTLTTSDYREFDTRTRENLLAPQPVMPGQRNDEVTAAAQNIPAGHGKDGTQKPLTVIRSGPRA